MLSSQLTLLLENTWREAQAIGEAASTTDESTTTAGDAEEDFQWKTVGKDKLPTEESVCMSFGFRLQDIYTPPNEHRIGEGSLLRLLSLI